MSGKLMYVGAVLVVAAVAGWLLIGSQAVTLATNTLIEGDYRVTKRTILSDGAKLTVQGNLIVDREIACENGSVNIDVEGDAIINGALTCKRPAEVEADDGGMGIILLVKGGVTFSKNASVVTNGSVQIVSDIKDIVTTQSELNRLYQETGENTGSGPRIGPFDEGVVQRGVGEYQEPALPGIFIPAARAQTPTDKEGNEVENIVIGGVWHVGDGGNPPGGLQIPTPPKGVHKIILNFNFGANRDVTLKNFELYGPDGEAGDNAEKTCNAIGKDGKDAMRLRVVAKDITIDNFTLGLGNGGAGGGAETDRNCDPGIARGGKGGEAGNFKMTAEGSISIASFHIVPGVGGAGGSAYAYGKDGLDGCPGKKGGDATATGGAGGKNKKELAVDGAVSGVNNVTIDQVVGGFGGSAVAKPGKGGNGTACKCNGGNGGKASATGGKGGDALVKVPAGSAEAIGGNGGDADSRGGNGGNGGHCPLKPSGGNGGKGGDAISKEGKGGVGSTRNGDDGIVKDETGGNGGNGGDGCGPGNEGAGGSGKPDGKPGQPGKLQCPEEEKKSVTTPPTGGAKVTPQPNGCPADSFFDVFKEICVPKTKTETIEVIDFNGKYLPVDQLIVENEAGCGANHYHAARGSVTATDGTLVYDPGPQCGFGKVSQRPVIEVPKPSKSAGGGVTTGSAGTSAPSMSVSKSQLSFTHLVGTTDCPQPVGSVSVSGTSGSSWRLTSPLPAWLFGPQSGSVPGAINFTFTCQLQSYGTQSLSHTVGIELVDSSGKPTGILSSVQVTGQVQGQQQ